MSAISYKCLNCGAPINYLPNTDYCECEYCNSNFPLSELESNEERKKESEEYHKKEIDLLNKEDDNTDVYGYECKSCGASVVTTDTTTASFCYYCHSPVIITSRLRGEFKPDMIIPFKLDKEKAKNSLLLWAKSKVFIKKDFYSRSQLDKITGIYLPYWLCDFEGEIDIEGVGMNIKTTMSGNTQYIKTDKYRIYKKGPIEIKNILELAFSKINKPLLASIWPYNYKEAKVFNTGYLSGFFSESYDIDKEKAKPLIIQEENRMKNYLISKASGSYDRFDYDRRNISTKIKSWKYILLPVWILTYNYQNNIYIYAVNGQTGVSYGKLPLDKKRLNKFTFMIFIITALITLLILVGGSYL